MAKATVTCYRSGRCFKIAVPVNVARVEELEHKSIVELDLKNTGKVRE